ncbi:HepT-like ribonuclease domain-containing protein [Agromyces sp. NPDC055520]
MSGLPLSGTPRDRFTARTPPTPRTPDNAPGSGAGAALRPRAVERLTGEVARLRDRLTRATRDGRDEFISADSDAYDIGMLAVIHLADLVNRQLPDDIAASLPAVARDGLRATRNIAAHNYAGLDNARLWQTVSEHAPELLDAIQAALVARNERP